MPFLYIIIGTLGTSPLKSVQVKIKLSVFTANSLPPHSLSAFRGFVLPAAKMVFNTFSPESFVEK